MTRIARDFVHLRMRSPYSMLEGALKIRETAERCARYRQPALALTDTNNLCGALEFCETVAGEGVQPIIGASPRTQSALLQAMQEKFVTVAGERHDLPAPFHVLATQNPIEQEGTYPLPEAQLDRFLLRIDVDFPTRDTERDILVRTTGANQAVAKKAITPKQLMDMQDLVRKLPVGEKVLEAILTLVRNARPDQTEIESIRNSVSWGPGPRAGQALMLATRARALIDGRLAPSIDDVLALAGPILKHRMALNFAARADGQTLEKVIETLKDSIR